MPRFSRPRRLLHLLGRLNNLPNTLIGLVAGLGGSFHVEPTERLIVARGGWATRVARRLGYCAMAVGEVILIDFPLWTDTLSHERVHVLQGRLFGALYLPATLLGYSLGFLLDPRHPHDASPLELWADYASGNLRRNQSWPGRRLAARTRCQ